MTRIKLPNVSPYSDRHGKVRWRFRKRGYKTMQLPGQPGSAAFMEAYARALDTDPPPIGSSRTKPGSLSALIVAWRESAEWKQLAPSTRRMRFLMLEKFRALHGEKNKTPYGDRPIAALERQFLLKIRDRHAATPNQANKLIRVLHSLFEFGVERGMLKVNPAAGIKALRVKSDGFATWTVDHERQFEAFHAEGTQARLAYALLRFTGQRRSDIVRMGRQHIQGDFLEVRQAKTKSVLSIPITEPLRRAIDAAPAGQLTFLQTATGAPYSAAYFGNQFAAWCDEAGLPKTCRAHGIRKAVATRLADAGHDVHAIRSITGHKRLADMQPYTQRADQKRNAMRTLDALAGTETEQKIGAPAEKVGAPVPRKAETP